MAHVMVGVLASVLACGLVGCAAVEPAAPAGGRPPAGSSVKLGNFSVSLTVKDIAASRAFYEKLGFAVVGGDQAKNWLVLQNETSTIGLFQGMFDRNMLTYNPGWDRNRATPADFVDVRDLQRALKARGITPVAAADETTTGPGSMMLVDPDGNPILIDQHVASPKR